MSADFQEFMDSVEFERYSTPWVVKAWRSTVRTIRQVPSGVVAHIRWWFQRRTRGFDDRDIWSLDVTIAKFVAPRLRLLREVTHHGDEELLKAMDKMIAAMEFTASGRISQCTCLSKSGVSYLQRAIVGAIAHQQPISLRMLIWPS